MKAVINKDGCISCEVCVDICSAVFRMADDGFAEVYVEEVSKDDEDAVGEAIEECPTDVISIV